MSRGCSCWYFNTGCIKDRLAPGHHCEREESMAQTLPTTSAERKDVPLARGVLDYFPAALAAVAELSRAGNEKHNPGQELHHARGKSTDHADCILRHLVDRGTEDPEDGIRHSVKVAWRALALLQEELEAEAGAPLPRGARLPEGGTCPEPGGCDGCPTGDGCAEIKRDIGLPEYIVKPTPSSQLPDGAVTREPSDYDDFLAKRGRYGPGAVTKENSPRLEGSE